MGFSLSEVVPWGRSFEEYCAMFGLSDADLAIRILGCGDGPASFNLEARAQGCDVISIDPLYQFSEAQIRSRIDEAAVTVGEQIRRNEHEFVWTYFRSVDELIDARMRAMRAFLIDYEKGRTEGRYISGTLPALPFPDNAFDLAVCSHFLFLYGAHYDADFHLRSVIELSRVATEVRVFPLLELDGRPSRHIDGICAALQSAGIRSSRVPVPYEFQRGGREMLRLWR